jgi:hypothetical protein
VLRQEEPTAAIIDSRTLRSRPESGTRAGYDGAKRKREPKVHMAAGRVPILDRSSSISSVGR